MVTRSFRSQLLRSQAVEKQRAQQQQHQLRLANRALVTAVPFSLPSCSPGLHVPPAPVGRPIVPSWAAAAHSSHAMSCVGGAFFCTRCGAYSTTARAGALGKQCRAATLNREEAVAWAKARPQLQRLVAGNLPSSLASWPDNASQEACRPVWRLVFELGAGWRVVF